MVYDFKKAKLHTWVERAVKANFRASRAARCSAQSVGFLVLVLNRPQWGPSKRSGSPKALGLKKRFEIPRFFSSGYPCALLFVCLMQGSL